MQSTPRALLAVALSVSAFLPSQLEANGNVHVTRFWHNHQPVYWPEWMGDGNEPNRGQLAWDSIQKKPFQNYGGLSPRNNPENDLEQIFGLDDRKNAYQGGPRSSLTTFSGGGFAMSYSGALIDNVRQLGSGGHLGYGGGWASGNTEARRDWGRLDLVGFTHHHSLAPLLPKEVFRKEIQIFKQAWWKAWGGNANLADHSKGFFPTEMAYTRDLIDVLVDEGYEWVIVASHHISRTSPSYNDRANPAGTYNIYSSPPNRADQLGPRFDNASQWWYGEPNPGNAAWNVAPYAYQLHRVRYVNPDTGATKDMFAVPSDDVLSYRYGYANEGIQKIADHIAPHANVPVIVMPSTDGDNAWGGGSSSWMEATPQLFNESASRGYQKSMPGTFVNLPGNKQNAPLTHIEDGAWVFPEMCYGSPNFMKWIEPPLVSPAIGATNRYPGTQADLETPGYSLKFFSYAPLMAGANWVITAEQILRDQGGEVRPWVVHAPYGVGGGEFNDRNDVELAWHIYLRGLDSGFNYYGGLGNDDEVKPSLATKRAVDRLRNFMGPRMSLDRTGPTALKPQRFPYNPGGYTFGWFNNIPGDTRFLKKMPSYFYIWTQVYDVSGVQTVNLKIRRDQDGVRSLQNTDNETYAGGSDVEEWITIPMTKRVLPKTRAALNAAANNGDIDFFVYDADFQPATGIEVADYYFAKIDDSVVPGFRNNLFDYYVESVDTRGNISRSEIQHVFVEDDGETPSSGAQFSANPSNCEPITVTYSAANGPLEGLSPVTMQISFDNGSTWTGYSMTGGGNVWNYTIEAPEDATSAIVWFQSGAVIDSRNGLNWSTSIRDCDAPDGPVWTVPFTPGAGQQVTINYNPEGRVLASAQSVNIHHGYNGANWTTAPGVAMTKNGSIWSYTYTVPVDATSIVMAFNQLGQNPWDNNGGNNWTFQVSSVPPPTEPPPVPTGLAVGGVTGTSITLAWNAAEAASDYKVFRDGQQIGTTSGTTFTDTGLQPEASYDYTVAAGNAVGDSAQTAAVSGTTSFAPVAAAGLRITAPAGGTTVPLDQSTFTFTGVAGSLFTGGLTWTNLSTSTGGTVPYAGTGGGDGWVWTVTIPLGPGANPVRFLGEYALSASDSANDPAYGGGGGWSTGSNGGNGFGPWALGVAPNAGHFRASTDFGMWANDGGRSTARRPFPAPLPVGGTFSVRFNNKSIETGGSVGVSLADANATDRASFFFTGGGTNYRVTDAVANRDTGIPFTGNGLDLVFVLLTEDTYRLTAGSTVIEGTLAAGGSITQFVAVNDNAGSGSNNDFLFGSLSLSAQGETQTEAPAITRQEGGPGGFPDWSGSLDLTEDLLRQYAIGGAAGPGQGGEALAMERDGDDWVLRAIVRVDDDKLTVAGETTDDLAGAWTAQGVTLTEHADQIGVPGGCQRVEVRVRIGGGRQFLRLRAVYTP